MTTSLTKWTEFGPQETSSGENIFRSVVESAFEDDENEESSEDIDSRLFYDVDEYADQSLDDYFHSSHFEYQEPDQSYYSLNTIEEEDETCTLTSQEKISQMEEKKSKNSPASDSSRKVINQNLLESIFDDLDDELERQYQDEEVEFFQLETQVMAEEIVDASIQAAFKIIQLEDEAKNRQNRIEAAKSEIVAEKLMRPSEIRKSQRKIAKNSSSDSDSSKEIQISKPVTVEATVETPPLNLESQNPEKISEKTEISPNSTQIRETLSTSKADDFVSPNSEPQSPNPEPETSTVEEDKKPFIPVKGSDKVEETISVSRSSAAGSSLTKNTKRRKSFKLKHRRNSLKDSSLKIFSCLVSDVHDTEDASITSLKSSMPKSTRYEEKSSCAIM